MNIIAAADKNWGIGRSGGLLFSIPKDKKLFRELTTRKVVVMGRKTLQSLPDATPLPNRVNIVLTGNPSALSDYNPAYNSLYNPACNSACNSVYNPACNSARNSAYNHIPARGLIICTSFSAVSKVLADYKSDDIFIIGGQDIYEMFINYCECAYITKVSAEMQADRFLPNMDELPDWTLVSESTPMVYNNLSYTFNKYLNTRFISIGENQCG